MTDTDVAIAPIAAPRMDSTKRDGQLSGFWSLLRLRMRLDRWRVVWWFVGIVGLVAATTQSIVGLYDTQVELDQYARLVDGNAALIVQAGPGYGLDAPTAGTVLMNELSIWAIIAAALMSIFLTVRHTRTEEETERVELIRAAPIGRHAPLAATCVHVVLAVTAVAVGSIVVLLAAGLPTAGSLAFGAALIGIGSVFTSVAAVTAQVVGGSRAALGLAAAVLALSFVVRAVGDVAAPALSWWSPIGWGQAIRPFANERWWVLAIPVGASMGLLILAVRLQARRDVGAGLLPQRLGSATAGPRLNSVLGLAVRLQRAAVAGWLIGLALFGFFYGIIADQAETLFAENPEMADFFEQFGEVSPTDAFLSTAVFMLALIASGFAISSVLRLPSEEAAMRADWLLATPTARHTWATSHLIVATVGATAIIAMSGAATGLGFAAVSGDAGQVPRVVGAALVFAPALWLLSGATAMLIGASARAANAAWAMLAFLVVVGLFGALLELPQWVRNLSPFEHAPSLPGGSFNVMPLIVLTALAVLSSAVGVRALAHRDIG
jgi:ABC-2 type transport system permease protein